MLLVDCAYERVILTKIDFIRLKQKLQLIHNAPVKIGAAYRKEYSHLNFSLSVRYDVQLFKNFN